MPFSFNYLARNSSSGNIDAGKAWIYNGTSSGSNEAVATIAASGYFNDAQVILTDYFPSGVTGTQGALAVNDLIQVNGNDANGLYIVTSITTNVTVASFTPIGSIGTSNIDNGAVTTVKIASGAITNALLAPGLVQAVNVTMNTAAVVGAYDTPVQIIPAPGVGYAIMLLSAQFITEVSTAFATGGDAQLQYANTANAGGLVALDATTPSAEITASASQVYTQYGLPTTTATATADITDLGIYFTNATGAFTNGTSSTVTVCASYMVIPAV